MKGVECFEFLIEVVNELERVVCSLDKGNPRGKNEALIHEFFRIFRGVERIVPEGYEELRKFPSCFDEKALLKYYDGFFADWDSELNSYVIRWDEERRVQFLRDGLQALIWGLVGKALKYLPHGGEALVQAYEDLLNGLEGYTDTDSLEVLFQLGLDKAKVYSDYMSVKEKYRGQIKDFESFLGLRQILSFLEKNRFNYTVQVKFNDWWNKVYIFNQLDTDLLNEVDSMADHLLSLDTLIALEKIYRRKGCEDVQRFLSPMDSGLNGAERVEAFVRSGVLSNLLGGVVQRLKSNPALIPQLREKLESCIIESLRMLEKRLEERIETCLKIEENYKKVEGEKKKVSDPPFITFYHTFFSPIIWSGKKEFRHKKAKVSVDEMMKEIEMFNPDRYRDFPLWWAKEKFKEKISQTDEGGREKLIRLFYKLLKGDLEIEEYHEELSSL